MIPSKLHGVYPAQSIERTLILIGVIVFPVSLVYPFALRASIDGDSFPLTALVIAASIAAAGAAAIAILYRNPTLVIDTTGILRTGGLKRGHWTWEELDEARVAYVGDDAPGLMNLKLVFPALSGAKSKLDFKPFAPDALPVFAALAAEKPFDKAPEIRSDVRFVLPKSGPDKKTYYITPSGIRVENGAARKQISWEEVQSIDIVRICEGIPVFESISVAHPDGTIELEYSFSSQPAHVNWGGAVPAAIILASIEHFAPEEKVRRYNLIGPSPATAPKDVISNWIARYRNRLNRKFRISLPCIPFAIVALFGIQLFRIAQSGQDATALTYAIMTAMFLYLILFSLWLLYAMRKQALAMVHAVEDNT